MSLSAMKQALEALEQLQGGCTDHDDGTVEAITVWCPEVIDALRLAIAQAEQAPICAHGVSKIKCDFCRQAPLTDEMLLYIYNQLPSWDMDMDKLPRSLREFARAIEAAHGIEREK